MTEVPLHSSAGSDNSAAEDSSNPLAPWSGEFDAATLMKPGGYLPAALRRRADEKGHTLAEMSEELGITVGYYQQLKKGTKPVSQVSMQVARAAARYLGIPRMAVLVMAGVVTYEDLYDDVNLLETAIPAAMAFMEADVSWGPMVPSEIREAGLPAKYLVIRLYEQATGVSLLPERLNLRAFTDALTQLGSARDALLLQAGQSGPGLSAPTP